MDSDSIINPIPNAILDTDAQDFAKAEFEYGAGLDSDCEPIPPCGASMTIASFITQD